MTGPGIPTGGWKLSPSHPLYIRAEREKAKLAQATAQMPTPQRPLVPDPSLRRPGEAFVPGEVMSRTLGGQGYQGYDGRANELYGLSPAATNSYLQASNAGRQGVERNIENAYANHAQAKSAVMGGHQPPDYAALVPGSSPTPPGGGLIPELASKFGAPLTRKPGTGPFEPGGAPPSGVAATVAAINSRIRANPYLQDAGATPPAVPSVARPQVPQVSALPAVAAGPIPEYAPPGGPARPVPSGFRRSIPAPGRGPGPMVPPRPVPPEVAGPPAQPGQPPAYPQSSTPYDPVAEIGRAIRDNTAYKGKVYPGDEVNDRIRGHQTAGELKAKMDEAGANVKLANAQAGNIEAEQKRKQDMQARYGQKGMMLAEAASTNPEMLQKMEEEGAVYRAQQMNAVQGALAGGPIATPPGGMSAEVAQGLLQGGPNPMMPRYTSYMQPPDKGGSPLAALEAALNSGYTGLIQDPAGQMSTAFRALMQSIYGDQAMQSATSAPWFGETPDAARRRAWLAAGQPAAGTPGGPTPDWRASPFPAGPLRSPWQYQGR